MYRVLFELHQQVNAIQMSTHNLYKEVKKKYIGCNLKTTEFLDCALIIGIYAVIRWNTVFYLFFLFFDCIHMSP